MTLILYNSISINKRFKYISRCNFVLWFKAKFSASLHQSLVSHDSSEIILIWWFAAQETIIVINVENSCFWIFLWKQWHIFQDSLMYRKFKTTVLNKSINFKRKKMTNPNIVKGSLCSSFCVLLYIAFFSTCYDVFSSSSIIEDQ